MTEHDDERKISQRYRELPREEPPAHLDEAIRAQARRLGATRPAPLVPPTGRRSWHYPAAAAAVLVLAVAVTWHVEREQPDPAEAVAMRPPEPAAPPEARAPGARPPAQKKEEPRFVPDAATQDKAEEKRSEAAAAPVPPPSAPQPAPPVAEEAPRALAKQRSGEAARDAAPMMSQRSAPVAGAKPESAAAQTETPEAWLERIAKLRREGRHEEADKALAEFRKRYPDFRITREMLEQVEKK